MASKEEIQALVADIEKGLASGELSEDDASALLDEAEGLQAQVTNVSLPPMAAQAEAPAQPEEGSSIGGKILQGGLKAMDYLGGLSRTAIANKPEMQLMQAIIDQENGTQANRLSQGGDEMIAALSGNPKSSSELMQARGVPAMGTITLPGLGEVTGRGAVGLLADAASDPLSSVSLASTRAGQALLTASKAGGLKGLLANGGRAVQHLLDPSELIEGAGKKIFKGGFGSIDDELAEQGTASLTDLLWDRGFKGSAEKARKTAVDIGQQAMNKRQAIYNQLDEAGQKIIPNLDGADEVVQKMLADPGLEDKAKAISDYLEKYRLEPKGELIDGVGYINGPRQRRAFDVSNASNIKTNLYQSLPDSAYTLNEYGGRTLTSQGKQTKKELAKALKEGIEATPRGDEISALNEIYGTTAEAIPLLQREAKKGARKKGVSVVDAMLLGGGAINPGSLGILAAKKAIEAANTTTGRTYIGQTLKAGAAPMAGTYRKTIYDILREKQNEPQQP
jgi:hypothetical protein